MEAPEPSRESINARATTYEPNHASGRGSDLPPSRIERVGRVNDVRLWQIADVRLSVTPVEMPSAGPNALMVRVKPQCFTLGFPFLASLALLGGHHVDIARYKGHPLAPAAGALQFQRFMLGDGLRAFKLVRISRNDIGRSAWAQTQQMIAGGRECTVYGW